MSMQGYTKLFNSIVTSTIWTESNETRILWITMLAVVDANGVVSASIPGLAYLSRISIEKCEEGLAILSAPDKYSRSMAFEGRRIEKVDGGWRILNHEKYRRLLSLEERREYLAMKQREHRERQQSSTDVNTRKQSSTDVNTRQQSSTDVNTSQQMSTLSTHTDTDTDTDTTEKDLNSVDILYTKSELKTSIRASAPSALGPCDRLAAFWNAERSTLPELRELTASRRKKISARLRSDPDFEKKFMEAVKKAHASTFLSGNGSRGWRANFDWLIANDVNVIAVLEGKYDDDPNGSGKDTKARQRTRANLRAAGLIE